jgi:hypothetical protein
MAGLAALFMLLLVSRNPGVLLHAEFWGDDGWNWYPDAYNHGAAALLIPANGYLNSFQRLGGLLAQMVPLRWAPTLFAVIALLVQVLPPLFIASPRMAASLPSRSLRLTLAFACLMLPNSIEAFGNLTNCQWHLAVLAFLVIVATPAAGGAWRAFDAAVLLLSGLSGPFCALLLPVALWQLWVQRDSGAWWRTAIVFACVMVQTGVFLTAPHNVRSAAPLGAGPRMLARIVALQVVLGAEFGYRTISGVPAWHAWRNNVLPLAVALGALLAAGLAWWRGPRVTRLAILFGGLMLTAALISPQISLDQPQWPLMTVPPLGNRYYLMPMLAWVAVLFTLTCDRTRALRGIGAALLLVLFGYGVPRDWRYPRMPPTDFVAQAGAFAVAPPGTVMAFPQHPPGTSPMWLRKK